MPESMPRPAVANDLGSLWRLAGVRQLAGLSVLGFTSFCLTLASLPSWAVQGGVSRGSAGAVTGVLLASTVLVQTLVPTLERRLGTSWILALGLVALGAPAPLYVLSHQLWWLAAVSAVRGIGFAVLTVIGGALTVRVAPETRHGEVIGTYGLSIAVPNLVAVPAGVALTLAGHFWWVAMLGACPLLALPVVRRLAASAALRTEAAGDAPASVSSAPAAVRAALAPSIVLLVVTLAGGGLLTFLPIERPSGSVATIALVLFGVSAAVFRWRAATLVRKLGARLLPGSLVVAALGLLAVAGSVGGGRSLGPETVLLVGAVAFGAGYGATQNLTQVAAFARAGAGHTITASAVWNAAFDAGTAVGAYGVGAVAAAGPGLPWTFAGCALLLGLALPLSGRRAARR